MFQHLRVIELASVLAGPSVGMFLAELGAEVLKIENAQTGGDVTRTWTLHGETPAQPGVSAYFSAINWGKKTLMLDLRTPADREQLYALVREADIVLSSYIPGAAARMGVDADTLRALNHRLICAEINGYGRENPRAAFDAIIQAEAGFTALNGHSAADAHKMPVALMDVLAAHQLKEAVLLALLHRERTGEGSRVSVSLIESGVAALVNQATNYLVANKIPKPQGSGHPNIVPYGTQYATACGRQIVLAIGTDEQFAQLCAALGVAVPAEWATNAARVAARTTLEPWLSSLILQYPLAQLLPDLLARKVPAGGVNDMAAVFQMPEAEQLLLEDGGLRGVRSFVAECSFLERQPLSAPPALNRT